MAEKEWNPDNEVDPVELQKKQIELAQKVVDRMEKEDRKNEEEKKRREEAPGKLQAGPYSRVYEPPPAPTFEERCAAVAKAWSKTKELVPDAPDHVKTLVFQSLLSDVVYGVGTVGI